MVEEREEAGLILRDEDSLNDAILEHVCNWPKNNGGYLVPFFVNADGRPCWKDELPYAQSLTQAFWLFELMDMDTLVWESWAPEAVESTKQWYAYKKTELGMKDIEGGPADSPSVAICLCALAIKGVKFVWDPQ